MSQVQELQVNSVLRRQKEHATILNMTKKAALLAIYKCSNVEKKKKITKKIHITVVISRDKRSHIFIPK